MSVIYKIENIKNNKCYVGVAKNFESRKKRHLRHLIQNTHHNPHLQNVYNKYGNIFKFEIIREYKNISDAFGDEREIIDEIGYYNIAKGGNGGDTITNHPDKQIIIKKVSSSLKGRDVGFGKGYSHSDNTKKKIGIKNSGANNGNYNRIFTIEERTKMSISQKKRYESPEERKKANVFKDLTPKEYEERCRVWSEASKGSKNGRFIYDKKVKQIDKKTRKVVKIYDYARLVNEDGYNSKYVIHCCNKKKGYFSHKGYIWEWVDN